ncbi:MULTISPECIES: DUF695 domain-containing protein [unclassified Cellulophaga]|uniref:DUF695 domain-containing protein n=1 Tax=unclassified Cellulophaga TaxID=2634405 RepID=UPI0026E3786D|nr:MULTISPECIES: DUF695 domain-containing protein [unclassified Cellulophaga]MDO6489849.1 DUF695 domain-containing protein [Cellulophaga sp. 2_MG-2023]MDO6494957.1 DUF695 domain-containing protein [Cellulophaga sp. 3_MG-2023]
MSFLKSLFKSKEDPINSYEDFWKWFTQNQQDFYNIIKDNGNVNKDFFEKLTPKLEEVKDGFWFLAGMFDDNTAELILTADGVIKNIVFVEELVAAAPKMKNWKITALKQPSDLGQFGIKMEDYEFNNEKMNFYATEHQYMPDEIDITITHKDFNEEDRPVITNGVYLALDHSLGELNSITKIDNVTIIDPKDAESDLVPLEKLKDFLIWREKEFVEKYKGLRHNTDNDSYSSLEATLKNGLPLIAVINTDLLAWDSKASHPWIAVMEIKYDGDNNNGMPDSDTYQLLNEIEDKITADLKDSDGFLNVGRQTAESTREVYFACIDFRKPSKVLHKIKKEYENIIDLDFDIYKDKYWQSFNRFMPN